MSIFYTIKRQRKCLILPVCLSVCLIAGFLFIFVNPLCLGSALSIYSCSLILAFFVRFVKSIPFLCKRKTRSRFGTGIVYKNFHSTESDVECHHDGKAEGKGEDADIGVFARAHLGDEFFDDNVDHGTGGKG